MWGELKVSRLPQSLKRKERNLGNAAAVTQSLKPPAIVSHFAMMTETSGLGSLLFFLEASKEVQLTGHPLDTQTTKFAEDNHKIPSTLPYPTHTHTQVMWKIIVQLL